MPSPVVAPSYKVTVAFGSSAFAHQVQSVRWTGAGRRALDTTHMLTTQPTGTSFGGRTFIPAPLADPGILEVDVHFNPDNNTLLNVTTAETCTVRWHDLATDATWASASGFVIGVDVRAEQGENDTLMLATFRIKMSGAVTVTAGV